LGYLASSLLISIKGLSYLCYCELGYFFISYIFLFSSSIDAGMLFSRVLDGILTITFAYSLISLGATTYSSFAV